MLLNLLNLVIHIFSAQALHGINDVFEVAHLCFKYFYFKLLFQEFLSDDRGKLGRLQKLFQEVLEAFVKLLS